MGFNKRLFTGGDAGGIVAAENFAPVLYTGSGGTQNITNVGFAPDLVIIKKRGSSTNSQNNTQDTVRGIGSSGGAKIIYTDSSETEIVVADTTNFASFNSDGFTVGGNTFYNGSTETYVSWNFKGGGAASSNTDGTITSQVSKNVAAGFSIATYTGNGTQNATIGHGLESAPDMVIIKSRTGNDAWFVSHSSLSSNQFVELNTTGAATTNSALNHERLSTTFKTTGSSPHDMINKSGADYVMYSFKNITGYQKFGTYEGNQTTGVDNQIDFGFAPRFVLIKNADSAGSQWMVFDSVRTNGMALYLNSVSAEVDYTGDLTLSSQGLRFGSTNINVNRSGDSYLYWAIA